MLVSKWPDLGMWRIHIRLQSPLAFSLSGPEPPPPAPAVSEAITLLKMSPTEKVTQKTSNLPEDNVESAQIYAQKEKHMKRLIVAQTIDKINRVCIPLYMSTFPVIFFIVCIAQ